MVTINAKAQQVSEAKKKKVSPEILKLLGESENTLPKSGTYTACCTNDEMAELILEMINVTTAIGTVDAIKTF